MEASYITRTRVCGVVACSVSWRSLTRKTQASSTIHGQCASVRMRYDRYDMAAKMGAKITLMCAKLVFCVEKQNSQELCLMPIACSALAAS